MPWETRDGSRLGERRGPQLGPGPEEVARLGIFREQFVEVREGQGEGGGGREGNRGEGGRG